MKTLFLSLMTTMSISAFASSGRLLTHQQFKQLSKENQVKYLKGIQNIYVKMTEKSPYIAEQLSSTNRVPASNSELGHDFSLGDADELQNQSSTNGNEATGTKREKTGQPQPERAQAATPQEGQRSAGTSPPGATATPLRAAGGSAQPAAAALPTPAAAQTNVAVTPPSGAPVRDTPKPAATVPAVNPPASAVPSQTPASTTTPSRTEVRTASDKSLPKAVDAKASTAQAPATPAVLPTPAGPAATATPAVADTNKVPIPDAKGPFRCMYSGWVIEGNQCRPPTKLPKWMRYEGMVDQNKSCAKHEAICNPVLFGLSLPEDCDTFEKCPEKAKVLCAKVGLKPTWECRQKAQSSDSKATKVAVDLNKKYQQYYTRNQEMFDDLCGTEEQIAENKFVKNRKNSAYVAKDIFETCEEARKQLTELNEKVGANESAGATAGSNNSSGSGTGSGTGSGAPANSGARDSKR